MPEPAARAVLARMTAAALGVAALGACASAPPPPEPASFETGGASCANASSGDPRFARPLSPGAVDPALIDRAVRFYTNAERCSAGVPPVDADPALAEAAAIHSRDMASSGFVAPVRPADPEQTLARRYELAGVGPYKQRGENLMRLSLERPGLSARRVAPDCDFSRITLAGGVIPTYRSVARRLVDAWMKSEALRANMLSAEWTHVGSAIGVRPVEGTCGEVYAAQSFKAL